MRIEHIALWTNQLEVVKDFYVRFLGAVAGERYHNPRKEFCSYFLSFDQGGTRLELMQIPSVSDNLAPADIAMKGLTHLALSVGSETRVDTLTEELRAAGIPVVGEPRRTGDGYYESIVLDPDGTRIELTA